MSFEILKWLALLAVDIPAIFLAVSLVGLPRVVATPLFLAGGVFFVMGNVALFLAFLAESVEVESEEEKSKREMRERDNYY